MVSISIIVGLLLLIIVLLLLTIIIGVRQGSKQEARPGDMINYSRQGEGADR